MKVPSRAECYTLIRDMDMMTHIVSHSLQVCRVAVWITDGLLSIGAVLNRDLIRAAALLHDITKTRSFETGENHAQTGYIFLAKRGFPEAGDIVRQHVCLDAYRFDTPPTEAEIVNYADKRVLHDRIVSLESRMIYIKERYAHTPAHCRLADQLTDMSSRLEKKLFARLSAAPDDLAGHLPPETLVVELAAFESAAVKRAP